MDQTKSHCLCMCFLLSDVLLFVCLLKITFLSILQAESPNIFFMQTSFMLPHKITTYKSLIGFTTETLKFPPSPHALPFYPLLPLNPLLRIGHIPDSRLDTAVTELSPVVGSRDRVELGLAPGHLSGTLRSLISFLPCTNLRVMRLKFRFEGERKHFAFLVWAAYLHLAYVVSAVLFPITLFLICVFHIHCS